MFKENKLLAIVVLFLFVVVMGSCGGGGGDGGGGGISSGNESGPAFDATVGNINEDALLVVIGSSSFSPPASSVLLKQRSAEPYSNEIVQAQALVNGVPWVPQVPPGSWEKTGNCGPTSYLMAESFHFKYPLIPENSEDSIKKIVDWLVANRDDYHLPQGEDYYNGDTINGTSIYQLADLATRKGGFESRPITSESPNILLEELKKGHPVIVRVLYQGCLKDVGCNNTDDMKVEGREKYGHYMLLVGMDDNYVYVNDPGRSLANRNYAEFKRYALSSFIRVWNQLGPQGQNTGVILYPKGSRLPIGIDAKSLSLVNGKIDQQYYATLAAIDGYPPYKWTIVNGSLPDGLYLTQDGKITGTPTREGKFIFTLRVEDSTQAVADATTSITISSITQPLKINTARGLPTGWVNVIYSMGLSASGGTGPYVWTKVSGNMPNGLSLIEDGRIAGTPSVSGTYIFSLQVTDNSSPQQIVSKEFAITILPSNTSPIIYSITADPSTVNPNSTSTVTCNASDPDNDPLTYSWAATGGTIPPGSGSVATWTAPSTAGTYTITCSVSDGKGGTASKGVNITVTESTTPLSITTTSLPSGTVGVSYGTNLSASGGKTPYTWSIISGSLPPSLSLSGALISGTPTTAGTYNFTIQVKDSSSPQQTASKALSIVINPPATYSISGRVTLNGSGLSGVTITLTGTGSTSTTTISDGSYTFTGAQNGSYTITPSKSGYTFNPSSIPLTVSNANVTGQDFTATQTTQTFALIVNKTGSGSGTVTSSPAGINCGSTCSASFNQGTPVTLTATPASGSTFGGWSGPCGGTGTCNVTMDSNKTVIATFNVTPTAALSFTGLSPSTVSTSIAGYQATLSASGSNFNNVNKVTFSLSGATSGTYIWNRGDANWNAKVTVNSDNSMTLRPVVTEAGDPSGTTTWNVTLTDTTGATASRSFTVTYTPTTAQSERITNGSFSSGPSGWVLGYDFWAGTDGLNPKTPPGYAAGGVNSSGYPKDNASGYMYQTVTIPSNATSATLSFWCYITTQETGSIGNDFLNVTIQNSSGNYLATVAFLSNLNKGTGYSQITFNMIPYKGQTIRINFLATTNSSLNTVFRIDDVSLMADGN